MGNFFLPEFLFSSSIIIKIFLTMNYTWIKRRILQKFLVAQQVKDLGSPLLCLGWLLCLGFDPWPGNFCMLWAWPKKVDYKDKKILRLALKIFFFLLGIAVVKILHFLQVNSAEKNENGIWLGESSKETTLHNHPLFFSLPFKVTVTC